MGSINVLTTVQGRAGPVALADGAEGIPRLGGQGESVVQQLHGQFYEVAKRGSLFMAATAVSGVAPGTAIGTTAAFALANPAGSEFDLVIAKASMSYLSGTLGIGFVNWIAHRDPAQAIITGTAITVVAGRISGVAGVGRPFTTATVPASGVLTRLAFNLPPMLATTVLGPWRIDDDVQGAIVVAPGTAVSLQATAAAGTTPLVIYGCMWEEVPV